MQVRIRVHKPKTIEQIIRNSKVSLVYVIGRWSLSGATFWPRKFVIVLESGWHTLVLKGSRPDKIHYYLYSLRRRNFRSYYTLVSRGIISIPPEWVKAMLLTTLPATPPDEGGEQVYWVASTPYKISFS